MHDTTFDKFQEWDTSVQKAEFDKMMAELDRFRNQKYGLVFNENVHQEKVVADCLKQLPVLVAPPSDNDLPPLVHHVATQKDLLDHDPERPQPTHLLIEGDNYHALAALAYTHKAAVDLIYIDPPYNTGERDFRYNDDFVSEEDSARHTKWLSFMKRRLELASQLLSDTGVLVIHIDENEFASLDLLLKSIYPFTEDSSLGVIIWNKKNPKGDAKGVATMHEYLFCYAKDKSKFKLLNKVLQRQKPNGVEILRKAKRLFSKLGKIEVPDEVKEVIRGFNFLDTEIERFKVRYDLALVNKEFQSWMNRQTFSGGEKAYKFIDEKGFVYRGVSMAWPNKERAPNDYLKPLIHPITGLECPVPLRGWRNPPNTMAKLLKQGLILFGEDETTQPVRKYLLEENLYENTPSIFEFAGSDEDLFKSLEIKFPYPKPVEVVKYFIKNIHPNPSVVLDFFAGSGTTGHAVLALNREDGGRRQFIMVTNNEVTDKERGKLLEQGLSEAEIEAQGIARSVTYPRLRKVIEGYTNAKGERVAGTGGTMRYFRVGFVPRSDHDHQQRANLKGHCTEMLCLKENVFQKIADSDREDYNGNGWEVYQNQLQKSKIMVVLHDADDAAEVAKLLTILRGLRGEAKVFYVFSFSQRVIEADFEDFIALGYKPEAMPTEIVELYEKQFAKILTV